MVTFVVSCVVTYVALAMITFIVSRVELAPETFLWDAGAVCTVLVYVHVYVHVCYDAHCVMHVVYCMAQCTAVSGLCICAYTILIRIFFFLPFLSFFSSSSFSLLLHWDRGLLRG